MNNIDLSYDDELKHIVDYVQHYKPSSQEAYNNAKLSILDSIGCALLSLSDTKCQKLIPPLTVETSTGVIPILGTSYRMQLVEATFKTGFMIRWLDYNDTWLAAEWAHPSDNLATLLCTAYYMNHYRLMDKPYIMKDIIIALIKAYEIQGVLALENAFNRRGFDHVILVKIASTVLAASLLGGDTKQLLNALSQAFLDGHALRTYRHAPNTGSRKSWAAGDAASRAVWLALLSLKGEMGYQSVLTTKRWGFCDIYLEGNPIKRSQDYRSYVMENILYKVSFPAEFHAQTLAELGIQLHPHVASRINDIKAIHIFTQESADRIINKTGALRNKADRDHCLQYILAIALIHGTIEHEHYSDDYANDPRIDQLRKLMHVYVDPTYSRDYLDPAKRSIANAVQVFYNDGTSTEKLELHYPIGHRKRREEAIPLIYKKFIHNTHIIFSETKTQRMLELFQNDNQFEAMNVLDFMDGLIK